MPNQKTPHIASIRSNFFRVIDSDEFRDWCRSRNFLVAQHCDDLTLYCIMDDASDSSDWPVANPESEEYGDFVNEFAGHLADNEVAILKQIEISGESCVNGTAIAINPDGQSLHMNLNDIYRQARILGPNITQMVA